MNLILLFVGLWSINFVEGLGLEPQIRCLDTIKDLSHDIWGTDATLLYAWDSTDLPRELKGQLDDGSLGIFYYDVWSEWTAYSIFVRDSPSTTPAPIFMYIKYYSHFTNLNASQHAFLSPAKDGNTSYHSLDETQDFKWHEALVELKANTTSYFQATINYFKEDDVFLVEKMIVTEGIEGIHGIDDMLNLCSLGPTPTTPLVTTDEPSTVPTEPPTTTGTPPPGTGFRKEPGTFPDPEDCTKFHVCQVDAAGDLWDSVFTCPVSTVWCQEKLACDSPDICPCTIQLRK